LARGEAHLGRFVLPSAVPIILFALLVFDLLALAGVILLSLALRYRAGTARRQARRWVASLNVWATSFSAVLFLSFTLLLSFWVGSAFRFALIGMGFGSILALLGLAMTRWESRSDGPFYTPNRWLALIVTLAIAARFIYGWWRRHAFRWQHSHRSPLADYGLRNAAFPGSRCWVNRLLPSSTPLACALEWSNGISDIEGKVARVATSKLGNERVSIHRFIAEDGKGP